MTSGSMTYYIQATLMPFATAWVHNAGLFYNYP